MSSLSVILEGWHCPTTLLLIRVRSGCVAIASAWVRITLSGLDTLARGHAQRKRGFAIFGRTPSFFEHVLVMGVKLIRAVICHTSILFHWRPVEVM